MEGGTFVYIVSNGQIRRMGISITQDIDNFFVLVTFGLYLL